MSWHTKTIAELSKSLHSKEVSSQELANYFLARIAESKELNAFVDVNVEQTLLQAKIDRRATGAQRYFCHQALEDNRWFKNIE